VAINSLGTKMFVLDYNSDAIYEYVFGTAFDLSTVTYNSVSFSVSGQDTNPNGIYFNSNGTRMFMVGQGNDLVYQYTLSTGFDLSTVTYDNVSFDVSTEDTSPSGIYFNPSGTRMFMVGLSTDSVYQYNL
jgi:sugar lactone lactonase YvrE